MTSKPTVLIIEDSESFIEAFIEFFGDSYHILKANSPEEAYDQLQERPGQIDVIIVDMWMPHGEDNRMDTSAGLAVIQKVCGENGRGGLAPDVPIIVLTGHGDWDQMRACLAAGALNYVLKATDNALADIERRIQEALDVRQGRILRRFMQKRDIYVQPLSQLSQEEGHVLVISLLQQALIDVERLKVS